MTNRLPTMGRKDAPILVVTDAPSRKQWDRGVPIHGRELERFRAAVEPLGFRKAHFAFVAPCPPVPESARGSAKRESDFLATHREDFLATVQEFSPQVVVTFGALAARQVAHRAVKITKARGRVTNYDHFLRGVPVLHLYSPRHVLRRPEIGDVFETDAYMLAKLADHDWDAQDAFRVPETDYRWVTDLQFLLDIVDERGRIVIGLDTETTGLEWYRPDVRAFTAQISWEEGKAVAVPLVHGYLPDVSRRTLRKLRRQLARICADSRILKVGHNVNFDGHMLRKAGCVVDAWTFDTQVLAFLADENMQDKSLNECVRRWVPEMAGYADAFDASTDKSAMIEVEPDKLLPYACGDADAVRRLAHVLHGIVKKDNGQLNCLHKVIRPALAAFGNVMEPRGIDIDVAALDALRERMERKEQEDYDELIAMVPAAVKRAEVAMGGELKFSRDAFVRRILFSTEGFGLRPLVFTKSTANLPENERVPSVSTKDHLPYFDDHPFVRKLIAYKKLQKMRSTYIGHPGTDGLPPKGFYQYVHDGKIHPSFLLHRTVTGRTASASPNAQNFPKRGLGDMAEIVKSFRRIFRAPDGWSIVECDLSQIELRLVAWEAGERTMLRLYNEGADIHASTAAATMGVSMERFSRLESKERKLQRFRAKAVNFGFVYGMWWKGFKAYAKTQYGIDYTDEEARTTRERFFAKYAGLEEWHERKRRFVRKHGYVRSLHGAVRHLPSIWSPDEAVQAECERQAINSTIQRFGSDLGVMALWRLSRDCPLELMVPIAFIHDALVVLVRDDYLHEGMAAIKFYMESVPLGDWFGLEPPLPIIAEASAGPNLGDMEEFEDLQACAPDWYDARRDVTDLSVKYRLGYVD